MTVTASSCFRRVLFVFVGFALLTAVATPIQASETEQFQVQVLNGTASERKAVDAAEAIWSTALNDSTLFTNIEQNSGPSDSLIMISFDNKKEPAAQKDSHQLAADVLGETADAQGVKQIVIYNRGVTANYPLTTYQTQKEFLTSVIAHEFGHAMGLQHNMQDKNDLMYPINLGPTQAVTQWDASSLPWAVSETAITALGKPKKMLDERTVLVHASMFRARVAHLPALFWTMVVGLVAMSALVVVRSVVWRRHIMKQIRRMALVANKNE